MIVVGISSVCAANLVQTLNVYRKTGNSLHLLMLPVSILVISSFGFLFIALQGAVAIEEGLVFYLVYSSAFPPLVLWAQEFTRRMKRVSSTAEFELGMPMPSRSYQLLGAMGKLIQELAKPIVVVDGPDQVNRKLSDLSRTNPIFRHMKEDRDGCFQIDPETVPLFRVDDSTKDGFVELVDYLVERSSSMAGRISRQELVSMLRARASPVLQEHSEILIESGLMDRLAGGILSDEISSGLADMDLALRGGYPKSSAILLCGPPSDERNLMLESFVAAGLVKGDACLFVSSAIPPENVVRQFSKLGGDLTVVDCYTNRVKEVDTITRQDNIVISPIEISVVSVAISRALNAESHKPKRAVVDILPTYLVFQSVEKIYLDLMEIIDQLRKAGYTTIFSLNPYYIKDQGAVSTLQELFDGVMYVERTADSSGMKNEMSIRVEKMAGRPLSRPSFTIGKPAPSKWGTGVQPSSAELVPSLPIEA